MKKLLRMILGQPAPQVSRFDALELARAECERRGWPWNEPVHLTEHLTRYTVWTNAEFRGANCVISIDSVSGEVLSAEVTPR